jgi:hypothetical protein
LISVERVHLVAGFGRIDWLEGCEVLYDMAACSALAEAEAGIVEHMNADHADALDLYATALVGEEGEGWRMTGIDPEGCDLALGPRRARLEFAAPVTDSEAARRELVRLMAEARARVNLEEV